MVKIKFTSVKKKTRKQLIKKLDQVFSEYIRKRNANEQGMVECFTCGSVKHWKSIDAGHFMSRSKYSTRWDDKNVQVQCKACNVFKHGEQFKFSLKLDQVYGKGTAEELMIKSNNLQKISNFELESLIEEYSSFS